jgi:iron complex outermembrane recepter protein
MMVEIQPVSRRSAETAPSSALRRRTAVTWCASIALSVSASAAQDKTAAPTTVPAAVSSTRPAGHSQEAPGLEDVDLFTMEMPVVVTASRREQKINTVPYAMTVITAEDIRRSGARNIPDALRLAPGVDVADINYANSAVSPRGFHGVLSRAVLILVDGRQIYDSVFGGTAWGSWPFQLEDIDHIEVIRGPGGVTWGSNAVNGVINIITKDPKDQLGLTTTGTGGSRGMQKEHVGYGFADQKLRLRASGEYEGSDGFREGGSWLRKLDDDYKIGRMGVHAIYDQGPKDTLTLSGGSGIVDGGYPGAPMSGFGAAKNTGSQASYLLSNWDHKVAADNRVSLTGYVNDFWFCPVDKSTDYRYEQLALQFNQTFKPADDHTLSWGIDSRTDIVDGTNSDPYIMYRDFVSTAIIGAYVQDEWRFAPRWSLNLGSRIDYEFYGGFQPSARASLSYEVADNSFLYGAVSRAFQMSPVGLRFLHFPLMNGLAQGDGRESVDPETLIAYELGYRGTFFDRLNTTLTLYWHDYDDLTTLSPRLGPPGLVAFDYNNRAAAATYGVEADVRYAVTRSLMLQGNYTYEQLNWGSRYPYTDKDLMTPPKHKFMLGARYDPLEDLHLSSYLYYVDAVEAPDSRLPLITRHIDRYFRLDLRAEYEFWKKKASVAVGVRNLLDPSHYEGGSVFMTDAEVPRMVYAEMRMTFK